MKTLRYVFLLLGIVFLILAGLNLLDSPDFKFFSITAFPGVVCLGMSVLLKYSLTPKKSSSGIDENYEDSTSLATPDANLPTDRDYQYASLKFRANLGIIGGILLMILGSKYIGVDDFHIYLIGAHISVAGWVATIWGCVNYSRWKGYSGWFGFFGYLWLIGLLILLCMPNKRKRNLRQNVNPESNIAFKEAAWSIPRTWMTWMPLMVIYLVFAGITFSITRGIDAAEWTKVDSSEAGFHTFMPGEPRITNSVQDSPLGQIEQHKFSVFPKGKNELFLILAVRYPETKDQETYDPTKMLEVGKIDILTASQGKVENENYLTIDGVNVLELQVAPLEGAVVRARIYATENFLYEVTAHISKARLESKDVNTFFDSFRIENK
jgi:hypothetical protein